MKALERLQRIVSDVAFGKWEFLVRVDMGRPYLQVQATEPCVETRELYTWRSRKWLLSTHMTRSEVVQTAFLAVMVAVEHETRESFTYREEAVFSPHYNVDALVRLRCEGMEGVDVEDVRI